MRTQDIYHDDAGIMRRLIRAEEKHREQSGFILALDRWISDLGQQCTGVMSPAA
jgi:hypothetical protein